MHTARAAVALALFPLVTRAELSDSRAAGEPWNQRAATEVLPDAARPWREDRERETRKDRNYWMDYRGQVKARLLGAERAKTAGIVSAARARASAFGAFESARRNESRPAEARAESGKKEILFPTPEGWPPGKGAFLQAAATARHRLGNMATAARQTTQSVARTITGSLTGAKNLETGTGAVIIALLVIFIAPAVLITAVALGLLRFRKRRR